MKLRALTEGMAAELARGDTDVEIRGLAFRSDLVSEGTLFFCVAGFTVDGHDFAADAVEHGAAALIVARPLDLDVPQVLVADVRGAMAIIADRFWGHPTAELDVVGITGTNGKTTTAFLTRAICEAAGRQTGLLGTVRQVVGGETESVKRTTPEAIDLQATFRRMADGGDRCAVMEVSSHALVLKRADGIDFEVAAFTNLTQDHLDFHTDMDDYFAAKRRLFELDPAHRVVNIDDPYGRRLAEQFACTTLSAGGADADWRAEDVTFNADGSRFRAIGPGGHADVRIALPGPFNVANALTALAIADALGIGLTEAAASLAGAEWVPGRLEPVREGQPFSVLVDYAHTPDSLDNVLRAARALTERRLVCVFGCGGDRDRAKRPEMGRAAATLADVAIVTSDNPRGEEPEAIINDILSGMSGSNPLVEPDREAAIAAGLRQAQPGDVVLIAGKGHEQGQEFAAGRTVPFDDREVARAHLRDQHEEMAVR
ncbi:MAG: UDP-N-acetylmuramoyl-L-alanyl-D-glutamate--2,6-diaminopimelate ligase [Solirubrobacterales bacterium]